MRVNLTLLSSIGVKYPLFYSNFHNVPLDIVNKYWGYYTGMGRALQTISIDRKDGKLYAAGSFQSGLSNQWYARFYMTGAKFQEYFEEYRSKGYRPRQMSVTNDSQGKARFSVIWEKHKAGQNYYVYHNRSSSNFSQLWDKYVKEKKWHAGEHVSYTVDGKRYHAGIFLNKPGNNGFYLYHGMSSSAFNDKFKELYGKWQLTSIHVNGSKVGGVWRPKKDNYGAWYGLTSSGYQQKYNEMAAKGFRLHKIQNYAGNSRFAAIFVK